MDGRLVFTVRNVTPDRFYLFHGDNEWRPGANSYETALIKAYGRDGVVCEIAPWPDMTVGEYRKIEGDTPKNYKFKPRANLETGTFRIIGNWTLRLEYPQDTQGTLIIKKLLPDSSYEVYKRIELRSTTASPTGNEKTETLFCFMYTGNKDTIDCELVTDHQMVIRIAEVNQDAANPFCRISLQTALPLLSNLNPISINKKVAWNSHHGYPRAVGLFEGRLIFAGSKSKPTTVWGSEVGNHSNFVLSEKDNNASSPFEYTLSSENLSPIKWILSQDNLLIGTENGIWKMGGKDFKGPLTSENVQCQKQSSVGAGNIHPIISDNKLLFVETGNGRLREFVYTREAHYLKSDENVKDLTFFASHITESSIVAFAHQKNPYQIIWCVRKDGTLIGLTYEPEKKFLRGTGISFRYGKMALWIKYEMLLLLKAKMAMIYGY